MGLRETITRLYKKSTEGGRTRPSDVRYDAEEENRKPSDDHGEEVSDIKERYRENEESIRRRGEQVHLNKEKKRLAIAIGGAALLVIAGVAILAILVYALRSLSFGEERVIFEVGVENVEVSGGEDVAFPIEVKNTNRATLRNTSVSVRFPSGFEPNENELFLLDGSQNGHFDFADLGGGEHREAVFSGKFSGLANETMYVDFFLRYETNVGEGVFEKHIQIPVTLEQPSLELNIDGTSEATPGEQTEYIIEYRNASSSPIYSARLLVDVSERFFASEMQPETSERSATRLVWFLGTLDAGESGTARVRGAHFQSAGSHGGVHAHVGYVDGEGVFRKLASSEMSTSVVPSLLSVDMEFLNVQDDVVSAGERVNVRLSYANNSDIGLPSGVIFIEANGDFWDFENMYLPSGDWSEEVNTFSWRASDIPDLADLSPGEAGEIRFSIPVKERLDVTGPSDTRFDSEWIATIDSPDALSRLGIEHVAGRDRQAAKLQSAATASVSMKEVSSEENVTSRVFDVGESYEIEGVIRVENPYNDVEEAMVSFELPSEVTWRESLSGDEETVSYDERRRKVVWELGSVDAGTGRYRGARELRFLIRFEPKAYQRDKQVILFSNASFSGEDVFTDKTITSSIPDISIRRVQ